ncbi:E3 ubiquitin-protein ligase parkin-like [Halichondria panicea]|uniref:E3 ubiquitin-protein ligase parkin-like n=1 Tax=Halichondria panicea TaxID=6063 RepID=UPI00312B4C62
MASGGGVGLVDVSINYQGNRTVLHLAKNIKVGHAIEKAAEAFKIEPGGLTFLYHGNEITDDMLVGDALCKAGNVTVIHLIFVKDKKSTTARFQAAADDQPRQNVYAHCKSCMGLVQAREVLTCPKCKKTKFQRTSAQPLDHFAHELSPALLMGHCTECGEEDVQASVEFECASCVGATPDKVGPLRQIRDNVFQLPCMKCGLKREMVFRMACSSRHTFCTDCFSGYCQLKFSADKFQFFDNMGYSISCPGPGADCQYTPVPDPHHFKLVDEDEVGFYKKFINKSPEVIKASGYNLLCTRCMIEIDVSESKEQTVTEPAGAVPSSTGLKWYQKLLGIKPSAPPPRVRKRTSCRQCGLGYCIGCKQVWHEGDCLPLNQTLKEEEGAFQIDPVKAKDSCWPQDRN